ncbi:MAG: NADH-quinone oxidoreductase subunit C [Methanomassiliicoccales archaeon]|nr:NADH-quinone oxidoreductase subunit C [Methanomassiliicoccales archaeon]
MTENRLREIIDSMPEGLAAAVISTNVKDENIWMEIDRSRLREVAAHIHNLWGANLITMHAVDNRSATNDFKVIVVLGLKGEEEFVTLLASVDRERPEFDSLTSEILCADWYEREIHDFFGITPLGHPELRPLVLYDDWPTGIYPLRKDFDVRTRVPRVPTKYPFRQVEGEGVFEIPVGPVHAGVIEPGHFRFSVAGEPILALEVRLGYTHKGIEKLSEGMRYQKGVYLAERVSGDNSYAHSLAYCQAVEMMAEVQVPERALYLRSAYAEMERIYNHLGDLGGIALDTAFNVGAAHAHILRERMLSLNDQIIGSRLLRSVNCLGGVRRDLMKEDVDILSSSLIDLKLEFKEFADLIVGTPSLLDRTEATGVLSLEAAKDLNVVGPGARASGVDRDVRRDHPYAAYRCLSFKVPVYKQGDVDARMRVKIDEVYESISMIEQVLGNLPGGDVSVRSVEVPEGMTGMGLVESPRGELVHWMIAGPEQRPFRHKIRDASFHNWRAMEVAVLGNIVPDFPLVNKSFNLSYSGNDL